MALAPCSLSSLEPPNAIQRGPKDRGELIRRWELRKLARVWTEGGGPR